jgi:hypothetical protein
VGKGKSVASWLCFLCVIHLVKFFKESLGLSSGASRILFFLFLLNLDRPQIKVQE